MNNTLICHPDKVIDISPCFSCNSECSKSCIVLKDVIQENDIFIFDPFCFSRQILIPPKKLLLAIENELKENRGLMIVDEITTGMGRCGYWFGYMHYNLHPDLVVLGKSLIIE